MIKSRLCACLVAAVAFGLGPVANAALTHRFSFSEGAVKDTAGSAEGTLKGTAKIADGKLVLENGDKGSTDAGLSYVEFKESLLPKAGSVSLVMWFTAKENPNFARLVNFGTTENDAGSAFIYVTPRTQDGQARAAISATDTASKTALDFAAIDDNKPHCLAVIIDGTSKKLSVYVDGKSAATPVELGENTLDKVKATSNWIGKSSFPADGGLTAAIDEFRVYDHALTAEEVTAINKAGAEALPAATQPAK
jgi:hypothetical protein